MYAVVRTGGKQYRVEEGRAIKVDRLAGEPGDAIELGEVLLMGEGEQLTVGAPTIAGARVLGAIAEQGRASKIVVFKYKNKTRSRKKTGHRQHYTRVLVSHILAAGEEPKPKAVKATAAALAVDETPAEKPKRARKKADAGDESAAPAAETPAAEKKPPAKRTRKKTTE
jgi:large subunit ribosomal protein L21